MLNRINLLLSFISLGLVGGCTPYVSDVYFTPHPAVAEVRAATTTSQPSQTTAPTVTAYATIVGVRRANRDAHLPLSFEVRLRIDNHGPQAVTFDPRSFDLSNSELLGFPPPIVSPPQPISIVPGQPVIVQANFPFPPGFNYDSRGMDSLQLHWALEIDGHVVPQGAEFRRVHRYYYYDPYWDYGPYPYGYPYVGVGGTFIIRR